jgi:flagellar biosynthesis/type III secretory pathway protein FliH
MGVPAGTREEHRYQLCRDEYCERFPCRVYKEGHRDGREEGFLRGYDQGYADGYGAGYGAGFSAGLAACPGPHGG